MSAIVWLKVDGELKKCRVDGRAAEMFSSYQTLITRARIIKDYDTVFSLTKCRTEAAAQVVVLGHYEVVR
jgi:hypothetical protein